MAETHNASFSSGRISGQWQACWELGRNVVKEFITAERLRNIAYQGGG
ncbi:MAG TPA: hypothetical protein VIQ11_14230 [Mycobacterium sp.]